MEIPIYAEGFPPQEFASLYFSSWESSGAFSWAMEASSAHREGSPEVLGFNIPRYNPYPIKGGSWWINYPRNLSSRKQVWNVLYTILPLPRVSREMKLPGGQSGDLFIKAPLIVFHCLTFPTPSFVFPWIMFHINYIQPEFCVRIYFPRYSTKKGCFIIHLSLNSKYWKQNT